MPGFPSWLEEAFVADTMVVTFTCRSCGAPFTHEAQDLTLKLPEIKCPVCFWSPQESVKKSD